MAIINSSGITNGGTIQAEHITRVIDALSGASTDSLVITGSMTGSLTGLLTGTASFATSASRAVTSSFANTAAFALNANEYMTIRLSHAKQTGTVDSTTSYFGPASHTVANAINKAGAILPFNCTVISASFYTSTDIQGVSAITYKLYYDVQGSPTLLANGPTLSLGDLFDGETIAIGSPTLTAGTFVNAEMTENDTDNSVEFTSAVDLLIKKV
jgi:hypothetical protein